MHCCRGEVGGEEAQRRRILGLTAFACVGIRPVSTQFIHSFANCNYQHVVPTGHQLCGLILHCRQGQRMPVDEADRRISWSASIVWGSKIYFGIKRKICPPRQLSKNIRRKVCG